MNVIFVFFFVVVSFGIETPFKFLSSSLSVVRSSTMVVTTTAMVELLTVLAFVSEVVSSGLVGFLVVFGRPVVDRVEEGVLKITLGFAVVKNCLLVVVCVVISGLGVLNLFRLIWLNVVGLIIFTSCPNKGDPAPIF